MQSALWDEICSWVGRHYLSDKPGDKTLALMAMMVIRFFSSEVIVYCLFIVVGIVAAFLKFR